MPFYTFVPYMTIIWCMVPEIWSATVFFVILDCCLPFYPPNNPKIQNFEKMKKSLDILSFYTILPKIVIIIAILFLRYDMWRMSLLFFILAYFCLLPLTCPKNENFKKMKKTPGDIILHKCIKNHDHLLYCSWDMAHYGCNYFSVWAVFRPFTPLGLRVSKIKNS